ncbi:hypothetical protein E6O75_ATG02361 [Venturia nashicola]|uniref:Uncharacterized protein n=1 Tax=Venturia nashicola TaxID=86259 RepID=A0A4Z1PF74_9PEZI|nr:hypothetical protein E6O75_ATG02361 [Venturia nashicola]
MSPLCSSLYIAVKMSPLCSSLSFRLSTSLKKKLYHPFLKFGRLISPSPTRLDGSDSSVVRDFTRDVGEGFIAILLSSLALNWAFRHDTPSFIALSICWQIAVRPRIIQTFGNISHINDLDTDTLAFLFLSFQVALVICLQILVRVRLGQILGNGAFVVDFIVTVLAINAGDITVLGILFPLHRFPFLTQALVLQLQRFDCAMLLTNVISKCED